MKLKTLNGDKELQVLAVNKLEGGYVTRPPIFKNYLIVRSDKHIFRNEDHEQ